MRTIKAYETTDGKLHKDPVQAVKHAAARHAAALVVLRDRFIDLRPGAITLSDAIRVCDFINDNLEHITGVLLLKNDMVFEDEGNDD